ncbi:uncharacterized protein [Primulina eburnea]|uniref:uncharacterized protein isoform X2 n=1 Tax=Primulina eburnea TaxID=1245227 RepID=UPI003C6C0652
MQKASAKLEQQAKKPAAAEDEGMDPTMFLLEGRLMNKCSSSSKLFFYDLHGGGAKVQVMADASQFHICDYSHYLLCEKKIYSWKIGKEKFS